EPNRRPIQQSTQFSRSEHVPAAVGRYRPDRCARHHHRYGRMAVPHSTWCTKMINSVPTDTESVLRATDVDFVRQGTYLLHDVSLRVEQGQHWALLGANGAGKSTLLSLLGAVAHPTRGSVEVLGHTLGRVDMRELRSYVGHVNPRHPLQSPLPLRDVVLTGLTNTTEPVPRWSPSTDEMARAEHLINTLGMATKRDAPWPTLSQGERGRALVA